MCRKLIYFVLALSVVLISSANAQDPNLVGCWTFDEGEGTVAADSSGNGYDGTVVDAAWVDGLHGGALDMAGIGYVDIPPESWSTIEMQVTLSFWAYGDPAGVPSSTIICASQNKDNNEARVLSAHIPWGSTVYLDTGGTDPDSGYDRINKGAQSDEYMGDWRYWTFTKNADTGDQKIYLDGELWHSGTDMFRPMTGVTKFTVGAKVNESEWYRGMMDDIKLYDRALSADEIKALFYRPVAYGPNPADGAIDVDTALLEWTPGTTVVSHKVYLSTDETIDESDLLGEPLIAIQVAVLDPGVTYYWRVDEIEADGNVFTGPVWSFGTLPLEAHFPSPADGATNAVSVQLSWTAGKGAIMHNVNFGTDAAALLSVSTMQMDATFDPGPLEADTTYYWRVDEFVGATTNAGPVWSFSTAPLVPSAGIADLELWYTFDQDASSIGVLDMSGNNRHGSMQGDPQWVAGQAGSALELDGSSDYVNADGYKGINADRTDPNNPFNLAFSVACWVKTTGNGSLVCWGSSDGAGVGGQYQNFRIDGGSLRAEHGNGNYRGATIVNDGEWHHVAQTVVEGANLQPPQTQLYVDGLKDTKLASGNDGNIYNLTEDADVGIGVRASHGDRLLSGAFDDVRIYSRTLEIAEIRTLAGVAELPYDPAPADGEIDLPATEVVLTWNPAEGAVEQDVYFGTDEAAVADANVSDTTGIYVGCQAEIAYAPAEPLNRGVTYFWRVDGIKADGTVMPGLVWNFRIADPHTDNWAAGVGSAEPAYLNTYVQNGAYDVGELSGDISYEFIVCSNPDVTPSSALIGRIGHGDTTAAINYEQYNNTGNYGATVFGVADHDYGVATAPEEYTHLVFVSSEDAAATELYVNGELVGSVPTAITLSGIVGIGQAIRDPEGVDFIDPFNGTIFGVAIYDRALTADEIAANADAYLSGPEEGLKVDFSQTAGAVAAGFKAYVADHEADATFTAQSYEAFGATVTITPSWAEDATPQAMQMIDRSGSGRNGYTGGHADMINDWIGTDTRQPGNPMTLTISGLPAGIYSWLSYHHDTDDQTGIFDVTVNDAAGSATTVIDISHSENDSEGRVDGFENTMRFAATVTSNGTDDITLVFDMVTTPDSPVPHLFFVMNGFELSLPLYAEDFESFAAGTDLHGVDGWEGWGGDAGAGAPVSDALAFSGSNSVEIIGTADLVKILYITGGSVTLTAMQYIPSGTTGNTFFILMNQYAPNPLDWSFQAKFSLDSGQINDGQGTIVYDQWVELKYVIDLDNNTVEVYYNGVLLSSGQWDDDGHNTLQAIDLYSEGASSVYYDDIVIE